MVPRAVQDAGYTAVGLGVMALQEVRTRRRELTTRIGTELGAVRQRSEAVLEDVKAKAAPVTGRLEDVPRLPGPLGGLLDGGRVRVCQALRPNRT